MLLLLFLLYFTRSPDGPITRFVLAPIVLGLIIPFRSFADPGVIATTIPA